MNRRIFIFHFTVLLLFAAHLSGLRAYEGGNTDEHAEDGAYESGTPQPGDMEQLASRFAFLSGRLSKMPEPPRITSANEIALPPDMGNGTISFGAQEGQDDVKNEPAAKEPDQ